MHLPLGQQGQIRRTFRDLSHEEIADMDQTTLLTRMGWRGDIGWEDLLKSQRVLIISEAGAGKTHECRGQCKKLFGLGEPAFYLDLAELAKNHLRDLLTAEEEIRLDAWLTAQSDVATIFLDSIDELNLTLGSFEVALRRLSKVIAGQLGRTRIIITARPIEVDQRLIRQYLPVPEPVELVASGDAFAEIVMGRNRTTKEGAQEPLWRSVTLMPLSDDEIREMAVIEGVDNPDELLADIRERDAEDFARRPQDLIELCADWREFRRIRTHREQVENDIRIKLKPRTEGPELSELSATRAYEGASRLALAAMLTRKLTIRHSVEADRGGEPGTALDPSVVLYDWTQKERKTLLERALFGFASYGRVRFHHRSVIEYLASDRLNDRLGNGMPIKAVKRLLFADTPQGIKVIKPTMRPVAAWLARLQPFIFSEIRDREANVLLDHADPGSLSAQQRVEVLRAFVQQYGNGGWRGIHVSGIQVHRFASSQLADEVQRLWQSGIENVEVRELLIELIGNGKMSSCSDIAYKVIFDRKAEQRERLEAIDALISLENSQLKSIACSIEENRKLWPEQLVRGAIIRLFPNYVTVERLCHILGWLPESNSTIGEIEWILPQKITQADLTLEYLVELFSSLTNLVCEGVRWEKEWPHLTYKRPHLVPALSAACWRLINNGHTQYEVIRSSAIALRLADDDQERDEPIQTLRSFFSDAPSSLREQAFWADDAFIEGLQPQTDSWKRFFEVSEYGPIILDLRKDDDWIVRILSDQNRPVAERKMMLDASICINRAKASEARYSVEGLKRYVEDVPELLTYLENTLKPPRSDPQYRERETKRLRVQKAAKLSEAQRHAQWVEFWSEVAEHPDTAFSPDRAGSTAWNLWQAMQRSGEESRVTGWSRRFIERHFSKEVADKLRVTMLSIWRSDHPTLRSERGGDKKNTILIRWRLGLAAIAAEAEDPDWASKLSTEEAKLAARYVTLETTGLPAWLDSLSAEHPDSVERILGPELMAELGEMANPSSFCSLLQGIHQATPQVARFFLPRLLAWLETNGGRPREGEDENSALKRLQRVIEILLTHGDEAEHRSVLAMASRQLDLVSESPFALLWLSVLMKLNPEAGTEALERRLSSLKVEPEGAAIGYFGILFGEHLGGEFLVNLRHPDFTPELLLRLICLAYRYVRRVDDLHHDETFTPGPRDKAEDGRNALLGALLNAKGPDAWVAKMKLTSNPLFIHIRDRLLLLAHEKAAEEVDGTELKELEIAAIDRYGEAPPVTRDEMFTLMLDRLDDLDDLLLQDVSPRAAWEKISDEKIMRQQIAHQLLNFANRAYTVDQEAVTADEKETDIRLRSTASDQQATIELKLGDGRSGRDLRDTLKDQLVTKYMAAEHCRSGCLLVAVASNKTWRHPETGKALDVNGLSAMLNNEASRIIADLGESLRLMVKVLDLRPRLPVERKR